VRKQAAVAVAQHKEIPLNSPGGIAGDESQFSKGKKRIITKAKFISSLLLKRQVSHMDVIIFFENEISSYFLRFS
jgi:hypothetical protein